MEQESTMRDKFLSVWAFGATIVAFIAGLGFLGFTQGVGLIHLVFSGISDPSRLDTTLGFVTAGLVVTFGMFVIGRWFEISDALNDLLTRVHASSDKTDAVLGELANLTARGDSLSEGLADLYQRIANQLAAVIEDVASEWSGYAFRLVTFNGSLLREVLISLLAGGQQYRISVDADRVYGNFLARFQQPMSLIYVVYVPRRLAFGDNPTEFFLRLVHIVHCCRARVGTAALKATVTVFLINKPRPMGTIFWGFRLENGRLVPRIIEYTRSLKSGDVSTPTAEQTFISHTSETRIRQLYDHIEREVQAPGTVEIDFGTLDRIISPLLPSQDGATAPVISQDRWRRVIDELYVAGENSHHEADDVVNGDHYAFHPYRLSICAARGAPLCDVLPLDPSVGSAQPISDHKPSFWSWPFPKRM